MPDQSEIWFKKNARLTSRPCPSSKSPDGEHHRSFWHPTKCKYCGRKLKDEEPKN